MPLKNSIFDKKPMFLKKNSKLVLKIKFNSFLKSFFNPPRPSIITSTYDVGLEILSDIPKKQCNDNLKIIDKVFLLKSESFSLTGDFAINKQLPLHAIPIIYGNLILATIYCTKEVDGKQLGPISLNSFEIIISNADGCSIAKFNGDKRIVMINKERPMPISRHEMLSVYFTQFNDNLKFRSLNRTTFSKNINKLLINIIKKKRSY